LKYIAWDDRNRPVESRTAANVLLGKYSYYDERGQRLKAERYAQPTVQVVAPNRGESFYRGDTNAITWNGAGLTGTIKLELLVNGEVAGTIAENMLNTQTSYQWSAGKLLSGWVNPDSNFQVRVSSVVPATAVTTNYYYGIDGRLLAEYDGTGACVKDYIYMGNRLIAEYQPATAKYYYYTSDQINSTRIITDSTGAVVYSAVSDPYGGMQKQWINTYQPSLKFSGKERESQSELDYFGARYYDHLNYRFLSVDPVINKDEALANPQLWNLYSYCRNSPVTFFDPDGRDSILGIISSANPNAPNFYEGHVWISVINLENSNKATYGLWPDTHRYVENNGAGSDVRKNIEQLHYLEYQEKTPYKRYYHLDKSKEQILETFLKNSKTWLINYNCTDWAVELIKNVTGESFEDISEVIRGVGKLGTPRKLSKSISELNKSDNRSVPRVSDIVLKEVN